MNEKILKLEKNLHIFEVFIVKNTDKKILILSMEGGCVRGILQAEFFRLLEGASKQMVPEIFDFFNGVSIGRDTCTFFVMDRQYYAGKLLNLYTDKTLKRIFPKDPFGWLNPGGIWYPKYKSSQKTAVLTEILKKYKIRDVQKPVMVFSYDYINAKACYFSTYSKTESTLDLSAVDDADATSAAVAYFLPKFIKSENAYFLDGCVISNRRVYRSVKK